MAIRPNQILLRWTGCCFALAFACFVSQPATADTISHSGSFIEDGSNPDSVPDSFSITNTSPDAYNITSLMIDFSTVTTAPVTFDNTVPLQFTAGPEPVGFITDVTTPGLMTLTFNDFNMGETFTFTIDVDDNNARVDQARIAGATVTAVFDVGGTPTNVVATIGGPGAVGTTNWVSAPTIVPEPGTITLLGFGLTGLAWGGRRR